MVEAKINWIKTEPGGKLKIPSLDTVFYPMIRLDNNTVNWSFRLINKQFINDCQTIAYIGFLMENAPHHLLQSNSKFQLYEGSKKIAEGEIL